MLKPKTLWDTTFFRFSQAELLIAPGFRAWLEASDSRLGKFLAGVEYHSHVEDFSFSEMRQLEAMIRKASGCKTDALPPLRLLRKIVYQLNRLLQLSLPQPTLAIQLTPLENPLVRDNVSLAHRSVKAWLEAEKTWLAELCTTPNLPTRDRRNVPFELLLFSAALHGGILSLDLAFALYEAVLDPSTYVRYSDIRGYVDLPLVWKEQPNREIRRWYPDDALLCLCARLIEPAAEPVEAESLVARKHKFGDQMGRILKSKLGSRGVPSELLPGSIKEFFQRTITVLRSEIPSVMVSYATRQMDVRSLLAPSIDLIYGDTGFQSSNAEDQQDSEDVDTENAEAYGGDDPNDVEPFWMQPIRECFRGNWQKELKDRFARLRVPDSAVARSVAGFANSLIKRGSSSKNKLSPNSIKCCVLTVARRLGAQLGERDPASVPGETLEDMYVNAIDQAAADSDNPLKLQATVAWTLREFHRYLRREGSAKPLNEGDVFRVPRGFLPVDATIVSVDDVRQALDYLLHEPNPRWSDRNREIARVCILLGFFAGLRTMEALGALRKDFPGGMLLPCRVVPSAVRDLKTPNATRSIFVAIFMEPFKEFQKIASAWTESEGHDNPLAALFDGASDDVIISMINDTLRTVTGNDRVRFYNLRHSFASWTIMRLLLSDLPDIPDLFPHLPMTAGWLRNSTDFRWKLYGNNLVDNDHAWAIAALLGHSRPNVSLTNYCHTLDILLPEFLRLSEAFQSVLSHRARLRLCGIDSQSGAYSKLPVQPEPAETLAASRARMEERDYALRVLRERYPNSAAPRIHLNKHKGNSWFEQTWGLLSMNDNRQKGADAFARYLGLLPVEAQSILDRSGEICGLKSSASNVLLHKVTSVALSQSEYLYPAIPRAAALKLAHEFAIRIGKLVEKHEFIPPLLDYYCRNVQPKSATLVFRLGDDFPSGVSNLVLQYRRFLRALGMDEKELWFEGCDGTSSEFPRVDWYLNWGLRSRRTCKIVNRHGKQAAKIAEGEWLSIAPRRACSCAESEFERQFFDAFRFAMLIAGIRFGSDHRIATRP